MKILSVLLILLATFTPLSVFASPNSIVAVDKDGVTGQFTSMALDAQGNPIISYYDATEAKLKVVHCFDKNCAQFDAILTPDIASNIGQYTSLALDTNGNPVVSYYDAANTALKVLHCGNTSCSTGNTVSTPDTTGTVGQYTSVTVSANNQPVVSYYDATAGQLKVLRCGNAACSAGNSIIKPDVQSSNGVQSAIKLNAAGNPVVAYFDFKKKALKILFCGNSNCSAGNNIVTLDSGSDVGRYPSLILDKNGLPIISYLDLTNGKLKVLHCGNAMCSAQNTITSIGASGVAGYFSSLSLNKSNNPVVSYYDYTNGKLNVLSCGNTNCTSGNTIIAPDNGNKVGMYTSLKLDTNDNPIISYYDAANGDLKVLHCSSKTCSPNSIATPDVATSVGQFTSLKLDTNGNPVVSYWDETNGNLKLLHCGNANCTANNNITSPVTNGNTGWDTSLTLDSSGFPVISFFDFTAGAMNVLHCSNSNCSGVNVANQPDLLSRRHTSVALDAQGHPVIASSGQADQGLRIVHCGDANCTANNTTTSPDFPAFPFQTDIRGVSMILDANGNPVVSFYRADQSQLKLLHCADAACSSPNNTVTALDPGATASDHDSTSVTLDLNGNPVIAYQDTANKQLKVLHCGNPACTAGNTISPVANGAGVGYEPSIKLDSTGNPVISYGANNGLNVLHCGNATCQAGNITTLVDAAATSGWDTSLVLDNSGNPVVSYYNGIGKTLKVLHCGTPTCQ